MKLARAFGRVAPAASIDDVRDQLWNGPDDAGNEKYLSLVLEQYKLCMEMSDRVSARRGLANTFFVTVNTSVVTALGVALRDRPANPWLFLPVLVVLLGQCLAWYWMVRSYRQLNAGKFAVIGALEERLPAAAFWRAEWTALGEGKDPARYLQISYVEQLVPTLFAASYLAGFVILLLA